EYVGKEDTVALAAVLDAELDEEVVRHADPVEDLDDHAVLAVLGERAQLERRQVVDREQRRVGTLHQAVEVPEPSVDLGRAVTDVGPQERPRPGAYPTSHLEHAGSLAQP